MNAQPPMWFLRDSHRQRGRTEKGKEFSWPFTGPFLFAENFLKPIELSVLTVAAIKRECDHSFGL